MMYYEVVGQQDIKQEEDMTYKSSEGSKVVPFITTSLVKICHRERLKV